MPAALKPAEKERPKPKKSAPDKNVDEKDSVWKGEYSPFITQKFMAVRKKETWHEIWLQLNINNPVKKMPPEIDFENYIVLALFLGQQTTGGYSIELTRLNYEHDKIVAYYKIKKPNKSAFLTQALTQPYHIKKIKMEKGYKNLPFTFIEEK